MMHAVRVSVLAGFGMAAASCSAVAPPRSTDAAPDSDSAADADIALDAETAVDVRPGVATRVVELVDTAAIGGPRRIPIAIRKPAAVTPRPVVVWSHGGAGGKTDPLDSLPELSLIHISEPTRLL